MCRYSFAPPSPDELEYAIAKRGSYAIVTSTALPTRECPAPRTPPAARPTRHPRLVRRHGRVGRVFQAARQPVPDDVNPTPLLRRLAPPLPPHRGQMIGRAAQNFALEVLHNPRPPLSPPLLG